MSRTRHAKPGAPLKQERYASGFEKGFLANLVAKRVSALPAPADRQAVWFLQSLSWQPGALATAAAAIKSTEPELTRLCLDPSFYDPALLTAAAKYRRTWCDSRPATVQTEIGERIADALEYTEKFRCLTLIDGNARIGKTFAVRDWCERSGGIARYVQVPSSNDDVSFFRTIGKALGAASGLGWKAVQLRERIEDVLQSGDLTLVFDEGHYCWPVTDYRYGLPARINWIMTALVNRGIGVAIITTPQFAATQKKVEKLTGWNSIQFTGRIGHIERLPSRLEKRDLMAVAKSLLPEGDAVIWRVLAAYAAVNGHNLQSIDASVKRARWFAEKDGRTTVNRADIRRVMAEISGDLESRTVRLSGGAVAITPPGVRMRFAGGIKFAESAATAPHLEET